MTWAQLFPSREKVKNFPSQGVKVPFSQTLHSLAKQSILRGKAIFKGKLFCCAGTTPVQSLRELLRELWFWCCSSHGVPFREWNLVFREWNFEFRELLQEYPGTLQEFREWPFHSESVLPESGVVPRLLNYPCNQNDNMQLFLFSGINFLMITIKLHFLIPSRIDSQ